MSETVENVKKTVDNLSMTPSIIRDNEISKQIELSVISDESESQTHERVLNKVGYKTIGDLGRGRHGSVHLLESTSDGKRMACKILVKKNSESNEEDRQAFNSFKTEIFMLKKFPHNNIIAMNEHFICNDYSYIVMEFADCGDLRNRLRKKVESDKKPFNESQTKNFCLQIFKAIHYLHEKFITHRDLKLANILIKTVDGKEVIKISDFGLSQLSYKRETGVQMQTSAAGTFRYMSPEIMHNYWRRQMKRNNKSHLIKEPTIRFDPYVSDMWALGVISYQLVVDNYPFAYSPEFKTDPKAIYDVYRKMLNREWKIPKQVFKGLSTQFVDLLKGLLEPDIDLRYDIFVVMRHKWLKGLTEEDLIRVKSEKEKVKTFLGTYSMTCRSAD